MTRDPRSKWPNPGDDALTRRTLVFWSYRAALLKAAPEECAALDKAAVALGEAWVVPHPDPGEYVSDEEAAALFGVQPATVRWWASAPHIAVWRYPDGLRMSELRAYRATVRSQRRRGIRG
ncbi:MAG TPA: hypothetical protein VGJ13_05030 [Pseudonocardiaceae bacterium]|jgi:hypothetical protein